MLAREETMASPVLGEEIARVYPVVETDGSDSSMLDNTLEFLMYSGIELPKAVMLCIPEPWGRDKNMSREKRDMFHYYASMMEPWDGPAAILFSDGEQVGAVLDRNGLRPARYLVTNDGYLILASEVGALPIPPERIVRKSRLQPGKMLLVDTRTGTVLEDRELKHRYAAEHPYGEWLDQELLQLADIPIPNRKVPEYTALERSRLYKIFGYTYDEIHSAILPMAKNGAEREDKAAASALVDRAKGAVAEVESYIKETYLIAQTAGEVSEIFPKVGELVGTGAPIMNIAILDDMWVTFNVREDLLQGLTMGTEFEAFVPALDKNIRLKVNYMKDLGTYAAWKATKTTGQFDLKTFEVKALPQEKVEGLRPGMSVILKK